MIRSTRTSERLAALALGLALAFVLGEGWARFAWRPPRPREEYAVPEGLPEFSTAAELVKPNVVGVYNGVLYRTNRFGIHGRDLPVEKPPDVFRIAVAGDSVTMGSGVLEEEAYPALLEQALNARGGKQRYEVLNLGVIGLEVHQVMDRLISAGLRFEPDLIVYGWTINDIKGPAYRKTYSPAYETYVRQRYGELARSPLYLIRLLGPRYLSARDLLWPRRGTYLYELDDNYFHNPEAWQDFTRGLDRLRAIAQARHARAVVFLHSSLEYLNLFHPYRRIYDQVARAAEERGMPAILSLEDFLGENEESLWVGPGDPHPNAAGHRLLARALERGLEQLPPEYLSSP